MKVSFTPDEITAHKLPDDHVALILHPCAAQMLADMMARIGGPPATTRRGYAEGVASALSSCGFKWLNTNVNGRHKYDDDMAPWDVTGFTFAENPDRHKRTL